MKTGTVTVIIQNHPPEAEDQDISVSANSPIKIMVQFCSLGTSLKGSQFFYGF
jgi:hypothetical protein